MNNIITGTRIVITLPELGAYLCVTVGDQLSQRTAHYGVMYPWFLSPLRRNDYASMTYIFKSAHLTASEFGMSLRHFPRLRGLPNS